MLIYLLMENLKEKIKTATKVALLAVGSELRGDDAAGLLVAEEVQKKRPKILEIVIGGTAPENQTGEIKRLKPSHLIIVDAAEMKAPPGTIKLISPEEIGGFSFSTHALPLKVMIDFILQDIQCEVLIIAVQPKSLGFGSEVSPEVKKAAGEIAADLIGLLR